MLSYRSDGYAVMNKELTAYSIEDVSLETCKRYCRNGDVVVRRVSYVCGYSITITFYKKFYEAVSRRNFLWIHWRTNKEYHHKSGDVVYRSE